MTGEPRAIIIDTDPGIDDAMAIAVALASPELEVLALTTTHGNHDLDTTTANAQRILDHLGHPDLAVIAGARRPLVRPPHPPVTFVHGDDGLGDAALPPPTRPPNPHPTGAAGFIVETVLARPGEVTLVPIGPLTNLALALQLEPQIVDAVAGVVLMGGAVRVPGNVTPVAEANIWADPEAADAVLAASWPLTMLGLDVTHQVHADRRWLDDVATLDTPAAELITVTAPTYVEFHRQTDGLDGIHCHDVATIAYLIEPGHFTIESMAVHVAIAGIADGQTIGTTRVVDRPGWGERPPVDVATAVDGAAVLSFVRERLARPGYR